MTPKWRDCRKRKEELAGSSILQRRKICAGRRSFKRRLLEHLRNRKNILLQSYLQQRGGECRFSVFSSDLWKCSGVGASCVTLSDEEKCSCIILLMRSLLYGRRAADLAVAMKEPDVESASLRWTVHHQGIHVMATEQKRYPDQYRPDVRQKRT